MPAAAAPEGNRYWSALAQGALAAALVVVPVAVVRGSISNLTSCWQETVFYVMAVAAGSMSGLWGFKFSAGITESKPQRLFVWSAVVFLVLYLALAALLAKIGLATLKGSIWPTTGVVLVALGLALRLWAIYHLGCFHSAFVTIQAEHELVKTGPYALIRHPSYLGLLVAAAGVPLVFSTWLPLFALPGAFVLFKWRIDTEDEFLAAQFQEEFEKYKAGRWKMIPYLY